MEMVKIVVFVPTTHTKQIREAVGKSGAGIIGNYEYCTFSSKGTGRFRSQKRANPFIGKIGEIEEVEEERIEFICPKNKAKKVIKAMKQVHPYEEVAFDIYPLLNEDSL